MKKLILFFLIVQPNMHAMENEVPQETWCIKQAISGMPSTSATYITSTNQTVIRDSKKVTLLTIIDNDKKEEEPITLPHSARWKPIFDKSSNYILTSPNDKIIKLSDITGKEITTIDNPVDDPQKIVRFNHSSDQILTVGNKVQLRNLDGTLITNCDLEPDYKTKIAKFFPQDERLIFLAPHAYCYQQKVKLWDVRGKNLSTYDYIDSLEQVSLHPEGTYLTGIRSLDTGIAYVYDLRKKGYTYLANFNKPKSTKFNKTGEYILTKYYNAFFALLWQTPNIIHCIDTKETPECHIKFFPTNLSNVTFDPAGNRILACLTETISNQENGFIIWDLTGNRRAEISGQTKTCSAKYNKTGDYIITRHPNNRVTVWKKLD